MKKLALMALIAFAAVARPVWASHSSSGDLGQYQNAAQTGLAYSTDCVLDITNLTGIGAPGTAVPEYMSFQTVFSSNSVIPAAAFTDGAKSTDTLTVVSTVALTSSISSDTLTVTSTRTIYTGDYINMNGNFLIAGTHWTPVATTTGTAIAIKNAINATNFGFTASTTGAGIVTIMSTSSGTAANLYTLSENSAGLTALSATFYGGRINAEVRVAGTILAQGTDWTAQTTASMTAKSISDAIQANSTLSALISSTWSSAGIVTATSTATGVNAYAVSTSSTPLLAWVGTSFGSGSASAITTTNSSITKTSHGLTLALPVLFTKSAGTAPGQLVTGTTYYVIPVDANTFKLSATSTGALAGSVVAITTQTANGGGSFTLTPLSFSGTWGLKYQASNDNSNWFDLPNSSSATYTNAQTSGTFTNDGYVPYHYIRLHVTSGVGALRLNAFWFGKINQ